MARMNIQIPDNNLAMAAGQPVAEISPESAGFGVQKTSFALSGDQVNKQLTFMPISPALATEFGDFFDYSSFYTESSNSITESQSASHLQALPTHAELAVASGVTNATVNEPSPLKPNSVSDRDDMPRFVSLQEVCPIGDKRHPPFGGKLPQSFSGPPSPPESVQGDDEELISTHASYPVTSGNQMPLPLPTPPASVVDSEDDCEAESDIEIVEQESESDTETLDVAHIPRGGKRPQDNHGQYDEILARRAVNEYARFQDNNGYEHPV